MAQFGYDVGIEDPGDVSERGIVRIVREMHEKIKKIVSDPEVDLAQTLSGHKQIRHTFGEVVLHICHHYLYHYAQIVYLRRAKDRGWTSNLKDWEDVTYLMGSDSQVIQALLKR